MNQWTDDHGRLTEWAISIYEDMFNNNLTLKQIFTKYKISNTNYYLYLEDYFAWKEANKNVSSNKNAEGQV